MYKSKLQEYCQAKSWNLPVYSTSKEGFDHCPQFKATVIVNGATFSTPDFHKSSKEAQNTVAQIAFDHLGSLSGNSNLLVMPASSSVQQPKTNDILQAASVSGVNSPQRNEKNFKEMVHLYKNQLQIYAQKRNLPLPVYTSEREGPPHACRFRSKVTLQEKTYECPEHFGTIKDAENAVAKVALMEVSYNGIQEEDPYVFKNLLQELAQKEYSCLPEYNTTCTGASHMPMFASTVEINEQSFTGQEARTKKLAEMNVAKVAYTTLKERFQVKDASHSSSKLHSRGMAESSQSNKPEPKLNCNKGQMKPKSEPCSPGSQVKDASHSSFKLHSSGMAESSQSNKPEPKLSYNKGIHKKARGSEHYKIGFDVVQNTGKQESKCLIIAPLEPDPILEQTTNIEPWAETVTSLAQYKAKEYPWLPNVKFPPGIHKKARGSEHYKIGFDVVQNTGKQESKCSIIAPLQPDPILEQTTNIEPLAETVTSLAQYKAKVYPWISNMKFPPGIYEKARGSEHVKIGFDVVQNTSKQESKCSITAPLQPDLTLEQTTNIEPWTETDTSSSQNKVKVYPWTPNISFPPGTIVLHKDEKWVAVTAKPIQGNQ